MTDLQLKIEALAEKLGVDRETIIAFASSLSATQVDSLTGALTHMGYQAAIDDLHAASDKAHAEGSLDRWAIYLAGACLLEGQLPG